MLIPKEQWKPADGIELEKNAEIVVKSNCNYLVIAGPGSGKTELLAQRACFLLQTGICYSPKRILAISYKKEAAKNLAERVQKRCGQKLANRFVSLTFDAFAKSLLDRFLYGLPEVYRPDVNYDINPSVLREGKRSILLRFEGKEPKHLLTGDYVDGIHSLSIENIINKKMTDKKLPFNNEPNNLEEWMINELWKLFLKGDKDFKPALTFPMISRLAEYILRENPFVLKALRATYSHVFLDEFQDITGVQYDLLKTCFLGSNAVITAVGDNKQRIMEWAGALRNSFELFEKDFNAQRINLLMNHRSAPRLVELQKVFIKEAFGEKIDLSDLKIENSKKWSKDDGICEVWIFNDYIKEAQILSENIKKWLNSEDLSHRDICVLVKQRPSKYTNMLIKTLAENSMNARDEGEVSDLLNEEIIQFIINLFSLALNINGNNSYTFVYDFIKILNGYDDDTPERFLIKLESEITELLRFANEKLLKIDNQKQIVELYKIIIRYLKMDRLISYFPQYRNTAWFNDLMNKSIKLLWNEFEITNNWSKAITNFIGINSIPIMTIHKSKGLEYDTVVFIGLEDSAFWSIKNQPEQDTCAFFVALSRAKRRVIITFSKYRDVGLV
ncbi:superfamily I DNA/RNA helicase [Caldicellulosiruptor bescii]|uniref:UvrD-helicase domain-containing protein n=1 Tax=Caldicellulosiruptor bescii TaxID=31899 RepID=UPI0009C93658|nr:ATP-dependent helicase [Caldicellulosiruptor bescii]PBC89488.1 superfamily I DNA/RNA helicase [Caldicellulosiruptor bescii]PBC91027.1 superfamily I DNA/RNA helicase [Caldicellulosiruptor bescii]PBD03559.1 superfamily I DNA/RNA helicase [Caldicellulosiruptor bescii]PBD06826.1 superfamily I DNA/RNA helicase [Caldicellulosiruptor bescii]PBD09392.1 superfamily I DNA/RNA helicase [Caldicellulosiruptor bescii]